MISPRKGLRRVGMRTYEIDGPRGRFAIERVHGKRWEVRPAHFPSCFLFGHYPRLAAARAYAERLAGQIPFFMDRRLMT